MTMTSLALVTEQQSCCICGIAFAVPADWCDERRRDHKLWYCPNGHSQFFSGKSEAEKLREQLDAQKKATDEAWKHYNEMSDRRQAVQRQLVATRGVVTRTKKRIAAGKCPCCKERFADLGAHMQGAHPGYGADEPSASDR